MPASGYVVVRKKKIDEPEVLLNPRISYAVLGPLCPEVPMYRHNSTKKHAEIRKKNKERDHII